ncbi:MAG: pseudouridine synthase [Planctomycetota bacterium]
MTQDKENATPSITVLFEDEGLVAVAKPSGMFVHRSLADRSADAFLVQAVRDRIGCFVYPLHRLDRPTSGLVLLAKSPESASRYGRLFMEQKIHKTYLAIVRGFAPAEDIIDRPLVSSRGQRKVRSHSLSEPQPAMTHIRTLEQFEIPVASVRHPTTRLSFLEASPLTGRYHQIRRHLAGISYPVIGDAEHGDSRLNRGLQKYLSFDRLMLAATQVSFPHPESQQTITINCPPEQSFQGVLDRLREAKATGESFSANTSPATGERQADR